MILSSTMGKTKRLSIFIMAGIIFILLGGGVIISAGKLDNLQRSYHTRKDPLYLPNGKYLKLICLDYDGLIADLFWIKGAIYFGSNYRRKGFEFPWLYHVLDLVTTLDPYYYDVYWYGSSILPSVKESNKILEKGRRNFPTDWKIPEMIGFNYHFYLKDYLKAARYYEIASSLPGHPPYVPSLAGRFYEKAGEIDSAIKVLKNFYVSTDKKDLQEDFARRIKQLLDIKLLTKKVEEFKEKWRRLPENLQELLTRGIIPNLPMEPYGGYYFWDSDDNRVISSNTPRF